MEIPEDITDYRYVMKSYFHKLHRLQNIIIEEECFINESDEELWKVMKINIHNEVDLRHLPIPVYSYVKPTLGPRFILYIMLSMGEFDTEYDLIPVSYTHLRAHET